MVTIWFSDALSCSVNGGSGGRLWGLFKKKFFQRVSKMSQEMWDHIRPLTLFYWAS